MGGNDWLISATHTECGYLLQKVGAFIERSNKGRIVSGAEVWFQIMPKGASSATPWA